MSSSFHSTRKQLIYTKTRIPVRTRAIRVVAVDNTKLAQISHSTAQCILSRLKQDVTILSLPIILRYLALHMHISCTNILNSLSIQRLKSQSAPGSVHIVTTQTGRNNIKPTDNLKISSLTYAHFVYQHFNPLYTGRLYH